MVKYLSDNRSDPRFQTILSKPQPLQAEVPAQAYPVDEVDMSAAFNVLRTGVNAYYKQQGEELQRESMAISYDTYQANRAAQKSKEAAQEKEKGLKNTMLNDYAIAVSRKVLDPYTQRDDFGPVAAERALRDLREEYIRNTGGVLNASELMKIEKDAGVTFTKDLYNADLQRMNEAYKQEQQDFRDVSKAIYDRDHQGDNSAIPMREKIQYTNDLVATENGFRFGVQSDFNIATSSSDPNMTPGSYISRNTSQSAAEMLTNYFEKMKREGLNQPTYYGSEALLQMKQDAVREFANMPVEVNGTQTTVGALYRTDILSGVVENAWVRSGIETPYTQEQAALKSTGEELENLNKYYQQKYIEPQKIKNQLADLQSEAKLRFGIGDFTRYVMDQKFSAELVDLGTINPPLQKKIIDTINNISEADSLQGNLGAIQEGEGWRKAGEKLMVVDNGAGLSIKSAAVSRGQNILNGTGLYANIPATRWDYTSAFTAMQDPKNTVLNGNESNPNSPSTKQKEDNTKVTRDLYLKLRNNKDYWEAFSDEDKAKLTSFYWDNTNASAITYLKRLNNGGFEDNIAYDPAKKMFVPVNVTEEQLRQRSASADLWPSIDNLNKMIHTGVEELDNELLDSLISKDGVAIKELSKEDRVLQAPHTIKMARALRGENWKQAIAEAPGAVLEGAKTVGETVMDVSTALTENVTVPVGKKAVKLASDVVEAAVDIYDAATNPSRNFGQEVKEGSKQELKKLSDKFGDWVLKGTEYSDAEKEQMKEEFYNNYIAPIRDKISKGIGSAYDFLTPKGTLILEDGVISDVAEKAGNTVRKTTNDAIVKPFQEMLKNVKAFQENFSGEYKNIPQYNLGIIARVVNGDETVTPEEAKAALTAYNQASIGEKYRLDSDLKIGMFERNIEQKLKDASKTPFSLISSAAAAELPRDPFAEGIASEVETVNTSNLPKEVNRNTVQNVADAFDIPVEEVFYKLNAESTTGKYTPTNKDKKGKIISTGIMQVGEDAVKEVKKHKDLYDIVKDIVPNVKDDITNPLENLAFGVAYMKYCEQRVEDIVKELDTNKVLSEADKIDLVRAAYTAGAGQGVRNLVKDALEGKEPKYKTYLSNHKIQ